MMAARNRAEITTLDDRLMAQELWTRRQILNNCARTAAGAVLANLTGSKLAEAQLPSPEPLRDDRLTFVTTTEDRSWQEARYSNQHSVGKYSI